jgi:Ca2+-transporting ATPase
MLSRPDGLSEPEARQRLGQYGPNRLAEEASTPWWKMLLKQFVHLMALLLWGASLLALVAGMAQLALAIVSVILINGTFSYWQEYQAEKATQELRRLLPQRVRLRREGRVRELEAWQLAPGDILLLSEGDRVSADARLLEQESLRVDQSSLSGESLPVAKSVEAIQTDHLGPLDASNTVFAGSTIVSGMAVGLVCATGMATEFGKIARLTQTLEVESSPLELEIRRTTRLVTYLALACGLVFLVLASGLAGMRLSQAVPFALGMVVAFVPEGLAPTLTLSLAMAVRRMAGRNALVKRLAAVETLGAASVICTDKTGTLTQNEMTVRACWDLLHESRVQGQGYGPEGGLEGKAEVEQLVLAAVLCNEAHLVPPERNGGQWTCVGDPTEAALLAFAEKCGRDYERIRAERPRLSVLPFDSRRKRMTTVHRNGDGWVAYTKGAPSMVLPHCRRAYQAEFAPEAIRAQEDVYAAQGLRVLALARRPGSGQVPPAPQLETDLEFLGLIAMSDPPRLEVPDAIARCHRAGLRVIMITGDHGVTAEAVGRSTGLIRTPNPRIILGQQLDAMSQAELEQALRQEVIFARASPENKLKVVTALQNAGEVVAVTGDGVNDAPALKRADIGVAMGRSGSDVAREAADMILNDDSFASIVAAIEEGRAVYTNIRRFISYIFTSNTAEAVPVVVYALSAGSVPLALPVMLVLAIDLGTNMVPALALGAEKPSADSMCQPPRGRGQHLITRGLLMRSLVWLGLAEGALTMGGFFVEYANRGIYQGWAEPAAGAAYPAACTAALGATIAGQIGNLLAHRGRPAPGGNSLIGIGIATEVLAFLSLCYLPPLQHSFGTAPPSPATWLFLLACVPALWLLEAGRRKLRV